MNRRNPSLDSRITILDSRRASPRSTANPMSESIDHSWICREDFGIERNQSFKGDQDNAQFSLCCTSTAMPDDDSQDRHPAFCFSTERRNQESRNQENREAPTPAALTRYFTLRETCPAASCQRPSRLISVSVNCTTRSNGLPSAVPFTRVFPRTTAMSLPYSRANMS